MTQIVRKILVILDLNYLIFIIKLYSLHVSSGAVTHQGFFHNLLSSRHMYVGFEILTKSTNLLVIPSPSKSNAQRQTTK